LADASAAAKSSDHSHRHVLAAAALALISLVASQSGSRCNSSGLIGPPDRGQPGTSGTGFSIQLADAAFFNPIASMKARGGPMNQTRHSTRWRSPRFRSKP
jgi:hypothetical protein